MLISVKRDGHFGRPKTASFDSVLEMDKLVKKKKKVNSWFPNVSRNRVFGKEGIGNRIEFCEGKRK